MEKHTTEDENEDDAENAGIVNLISTEDKQQQHEDRGSFHSFGVPTAPGLLEMTNTIERLRYRY